MPKTVYQAIDGTLFDNHTEAETYENHLFKVWLDSKPMVNIKALLDEAPDDTEDEYWGTPKDFVMVVARRAFENCNG